MGCDFFLKDIRLHLGDEAKCRVTRKYRGEARAAKNLIRK